MGSKLYVVVGGQTGSEAKGAIAGRICADEEAAGQWVVCVRVGGPNAGHTVIGVCPAEVTGVTVADRCPVDHPAGRHPWRLRQVPVSSVTAPHSVLIIAAGSEIDPNVLEDELRQLDAAGYNATDRLVIDQSATVLTPSHIAEEHHRGLSKRIGSTAKGIGAARAERIWREAERWQDWMQKADAGERGLNKIQCADTAELLADTLRMSASSVVVEGTQGYGLGLHTDNYPKVTSGDCRAVDFLAQAGISPWQQDSDGWGLDVNVVIAVRPYPIRVAGDSGYLKGETSWAELGLPEERTTVTNKVRRVGAWDPAAVREAIRANGGPRRGVVWVALTMMDSVEPTLAGKSELVDGWRGRQHEQFISPRIDEYLDDLDLDEGHLGYIGTGPSTAIVNKRMYS